MPRATQPFDHFESDTTIYKRDLSRFFVELRKQAHHIYALLAGAPKSVFWIVLDEEDAFPNEKTFSIEEFQANCGKFGAEDAFRVYFNAYFFRDEWDECFPCWELMDNPFNGVDKFEVTNKRELTPAEFESEWRRMFAYLCRDAILSNRPFRLDDETIRRYGFTPQDVALLQESVALFNARVIAELRAQYDKLAAIDCLHEHPKVKPEPKAVAVSAREVVNRIHIMVILICIKALKKLRSADMTDKNVIIRAIMCDMPAWDIGYKSAAKDCAVDYWVDRAEYVDSNSFNLYVTQAEENVLWNIEKKGQKPGRLNVPQQRITLRTDGMNVPPFIPMNYLVSLGGKLLLMAFPNEQVDADLSSYDDESVMIETERQLQAVFETTMQEISDDDAVYPTADQTHSSSIN